MEVSTRSRDKTLNPQPARSSRGIFSRDSIWIYPLHCIVAEMRIVMFAWRDLSHSKSGGAEVYTHETLSELVRRGHDVTLVCPKHDERIEKNLQIPVRDYRVQRLGNNKSVYFHARRWLAHNQHLFDAAIEQVNTIPFLLSRTSVQIPIVTLYHQTAEDVWAFNTRWPIWLAGRYWLEPRWLRANSHLPTLAVSGSTRDSLLAHGFHDVSVTGEGQPKRSANGLQPRDPSAPRLLFVGRLVGYKQPWHAIRAVEYARHVLPEISLTIVGSGPLLGKLRRTSPSWVEVLGSVTDSQLAELYATSSIHLATSVREGWGLVVSEASSHGVFPISYANPGLVDSTVAARGWVSAPTPHALGQCVVEALQSGVVQDYRPIERGGCRSWNDVTNVIEGVLDRALNRHTSHPPGR